MTATTDEAPVVTFNGTLPDAVNALTQAVTDIDTTALDYLRAHDGDEVCALALLGALRAQRMKLAEIEAAIEADAVRWMTRDRVEVAGLFVAERRGGTERKEWEHDRLASVVAQSALVNPDGTMPDEEVAQAAFAVRDALMAAGAVAYWRVGQLRARGIDPNDYCKRSPGRRTVQISFAEQHADVAADV